MEIIEQLKQYQSNQFSPAVFHPIGLLRCKHFYRYETPRQAVFAKNQGVIELNENCNFEAALADLAGFDRIWVIYEFHLNATWNVKVRPPVAPPGRKIGVFATRSPHRPNRIGMSAVELIGIKGRKLFIQNFDMLDQTPVLDIKPYIPKADSFPDSACGWLDTVTAESCQLEFSPLFQQQQKFLQALGGPDLENFCHVQLTLEPTNTQRKRLTQSADHPDCWRIGFRTWQVEFCFDSQKRIVFIHRILSNYPPEELLEGMPDPYQDKDLHRNFLKGTFV